MYQKNPPLTFRASLSCDRFVECHLPHSRSSIPRDLSLSLFNFRDLNSGKRSLSTTIPYRDLSQKRHGRGGGVNERRARWKRTRERSADSSAVISARSGTPFSMAVIDTAFHTERSNGEIGIGTDTMVGRVRRLCATHMRWSSHSRSIDTIANGTNALASPCRRETDNSCLRCSKPRCALPFVKYTPRLHFASRSEQKFQVKARF